MGNSDNFIIFWSKLYPRLPVPHKEYRFHPKRRWRFDYAWLEGPGGKVAKVALEIEGGGWMGGRHHRPQGYEKDIEKYNTATFMGWRVYRTTWQMLENDARQVLELVAETLNG